MTRTAVLYARVSSDEQARHGYSLGQQIAALREWVAVEVLAARLLEQEKLNSNQITATIERGKHG